MTTCRAIILFGTACAVVAAAPPVKASPTGMDFCARLAEDSGIDKPASPDGRTQWTVNAMNFGQRFLVGGAFATGVGVKPVEPATVEDYRRLEESCRPRQKGALCQLAGPLIFKFIWEGREVLTPLNAGERAVIEVQSTRTTCRPADEEVQTLPGLRHGDRADASAKAPTPENRAERRQAR